VQVLEKLFKLKVNVMKKNLTLKLSASNSCGGVSRGQGQSTWYRTVGSVLGWLLVSACSSAPSSMAQGQSNSDVAAPKHAVQQDTSRKDIVKSTESKSTEQMTPAKNGASSAQADMAKITRRLETLKFDSPANSFRDYTVRLKEFLDQECEYSIFDASSKLVSNVNHRNFNFHPIDDKYIETTEFQVGSFEYVPINGNRKKLTMSNDQTKMIIYFYIPDEVFPEFDIRTIGLDFNTYYIHSPTPNANPVRYVFDRRKNDCKRHLTVSFAFGKIQAITIRYEGAKN
jgi:hypothetical protein